MVSTEAESNTPAMNQNPVQDLANKLFLPFETK